MIAKVMRSRRGGGYIEVVVLILVVMLCIALAMKVYPIFIAKQQLDNYASELCREAEIAGRVGTETTRRSAVLQESLGITPTVSWSKTGKIQLNEEFTVTVTLQMNLGIFGDFGSFPITLSASSSGKGEKYWK